jgi:hypothetical protein
MPNDVFGLNSVYDRQVESTWSESANYGYFAGGYSASGPPYAKNEIYRIDYFDETVSLPGPSLTQARQVLAGVSNSNYGYFAGGNAPPWVCTIDRIDFSSETVAVPPVGDQLTQAKQGLAGVSNSNYGYFAGGFLPTCAIDRIDFSSETVVGPPVHGASLTQARYYLTTVSSSNCGYFAGGEDVTPRCTIDRIDFSSETVTLPGSSLTQARKELAGVSNYNYGYFAGGAYSGSLCTIDRIDFSSETVAVPPVGDQLTQPRYGLAGVSNLNYGYFGGGRTTTPNVVNTIDRIDFSSETTSSPGNNLLAVRSGSAAVSGGKRINARGVRKGTDKDGKGISSTYGYVAGGTSPPDRSTIDRLDYSTESITGPSVHGLKLRTARRGLSSFSNKNYGYFCNGWNPTSNVIDRIDFSNETRSDNLTSTYPAYYAQSFYNSNYGYVCGGVRLYPPSISSSRSIIERMDFETESLTITNSTLQNSLSSSAAVGTPNYGYFGGGSRGGYTPDVVSLIERFDFSNETSVLLTGNLTQKRYASGSFQNPNYGYFYGGTSPGTSPSNNSKIERLDFSTELTTSPGNMPEVKVRSCGVFNTYHGYAFGGRYSGGWTSYVHRMEFSDETITLLSSRFSQARNQFIGLSN